ncbi:hypothetical protein [Lentimicrobium sp.]|uniref:hypothetical protein n=1 Tax=Lentimicrobium sp. TaxID=2034841 RepID=UPI00345E312D
MKKSIILAFAVSGLAFFMHSCNVSTAHITDVMVCESVTDNQCPADQPIFSTDTPEIFCSVIVKNAPGGTAVTFSWFYQGESRVAIDAVTLNTPEGGTTFNLQSSLSVPNNGWPKGVYEVVISLGTDNSEPVVKTFVVE